MLFLKKGLKFELKKISPSNSATNFLPILSMEISTPRQKVCYRIGRWDFSRPKLIIFLRKSYLYYCCQFKILGWTSTPKRPPLAQMFHKTNLFSISSHINIIHQWFESFLEHEFSHGDSTEFDDLWWKRKSKLKWLL